MISELHPQRALGVLIGGILTTWCFLLTIALLWRGLTEPIELVTLGAYLAAALFFALGCLFAYWTYSCLTLKYYLDRNGLTIHWGDVRQLIPIDRIERLIPGRELPPPARVRGINWLGHHAGHGHVETLGDVIFYTTHRTHEELLYVVTPAQTYAISVDDEIRFGEELQGHQKLGQLVSLPQVTELTSIAAQPFWHDPMAQVLALASILGCAVTLGYVFHQYPGLPDSIPLAFPSLGSVTRVDDKRELLSIPITGIGLLALNLVLGFVLHAWDRSVGYVLFLAGLGAQIILLSAAIITINQ
ncbi:MAG: PH domain-containing protein [Dehalococcoidia bacterium]|nr:PH domain-containing protein [Dehalococcoidia bacterium]